MKHPCSKVTLSIEDKAPYIILREEKIDNRPFINPSRPVQFRDCIKIKINLNFCFWTSLCCLSFMKSFKAFIKPFEAPQRSLKIKIWFTFSLRLELGTKGLSSFLLLLAWFCRRKAFYCNNNRWRLQKRNQSARDQM